MAAATADVVIVGRGLMGTSIALHLARRRAGRIVLFEKRQSASRPTGRSSALLPRHYSIELYARMAARSFEAYSNFEELTGRPAEITRCGLVMAVGPEDLAAMRDTVAMMRRLGVKVEELTPRDLEHVVPVLAIDGLGVAAWETDTGYGDPAGVSHAYAARARELGVEIRQDTHVSGFALTGGRISGVRTAAGDVATSTVANATGPWGAALSRAVGLEMPIVASRQQLVILRAPGCRGPGAPRFRGHGGPRLLPTGDGRPGAGRQPQSRRGQRAGGSRRFLRAGGPRVRGQDRGGRGAPLPGLQRRGSARRLRLGLRPRAPSALRHRASPRVPGLVHALGFSGHGFKHSPVIGKMVAELVMDGASSVIDASPFSSERFSRAPVLQGRYGSWPF